MATKAPAKKTETVKAPKLKKKMAVKFTTQRGRAGTGVIVEIPDAGVNGAFIKVKEDGDGKLVSLRPSMVQPAA